MRRGGLGFGVFVGAIIAACSSASSSTMPGDGGAGHEDSPSSHDAKSTKDSSPEDDSGHHDSGKPEDATQPHAETGSGSGTSAEAGSIATVTSTLTPGTRLKGKWYESDGLSRLESIYDTVLDLECSWGIASDGMLRCVPALLFSYVASTAQVYSDAACSEVISQVPTTCEAPTSADVYAAYTLACPYTTEYYAYGAALPPPTNVYGRSGTECIPLTPLPANEATYYAMTLIPPSTYVPGTESPGTASGNLNAITVSGGDGSVTFETLRDTAHGSVDCAFGEATDQTRRCVPITQVFQNGIFGDSACTIPAAESEYSTCTNAMFTTASSNDTCPPAVTVNELGQVVSAVYELNGTSCQLLSEQPGTIYDLGSVVAPSMLTEGALSTGPSTGRLAPRLVTAGDLVIDAVSVDSYAYQFPSIEYEDTSRHELCTPSLAHDDTVRCLPFPLEDPGSRVDVASDVFADSACTVSVGLANGTGCTTPSYGFASITPTCGVDETIVYAVTGPATSLYSLQGTTCAPQAPAAGAVYYALGAEVPASSFAPITTSIH